MPEKGIRFQRYVKYKAKIDPNFGGGEKRISFRGKIEDMEAVVLARGLPGLSTQPLDTRRHGYDG